VDQLGQKGQVVSGFNGENEERWVWKMNGHFPGGQYWKTKQHESEGIKQRVMFGSQGDWQVVLTTKS
jgi:hypothetical protein